MSPSRCELLAKKYDDCLPKKDLDTWNNLALLISLKRCLCLRTFKNKKNTQFKNWGISTKKYENSKKFLVKKYLRRNKKAHSENISSNCELQLWFTLSRNFREILWNSFLLVCYIVCLLNKNQSESIANSVL